MMKRTSAILAMLVLALILLPSTVAEERFIELKAKKFSYEPNIIRVNAGDEVTIRLMSLDVSHGFYLDGYEEEMHTRPGEVAEVSFVADKRGKFTFRCSITCGDFHPYMVGNFIVEPNTPYTIYFIVIALVGLLSLLIPIMRKEEDTSLIPTDRVRDAAKGTGPIKDAKKTAKSEGEKKDE